MRMIFWGKAKECGKQGCLAGHGPTRYYDRGSFPSDNARMHEDSSARQDPDAQAHVRVEGVKDRFEFSITCQPPGITINKVEQPNVSARILPANDERIEPLNRRFLTLLPAWGQQMRE